METSLLAILDQVITSLGVEKVQERLENFKPKAIVTQPDPPKVETTTKDKKLNIGRVSDVMKKTLQASLTNAKIVFNDTQLNNYKKKFAEYANSLDSVTYSLKKPEVHIRDFVSSLQPVQSSSSNSEIITKMVSLEELQNMKATLSSPEGIIHGVYWENSQGIYVRGPDKDPDEDYVEKTFQNKSYMVGEKTGRVYEIREENDDTFDGKFLGFMGIGQFANN